MKKIAIIGKDSFIGSNLFEYLSAFNNYELIGTTFETLDITKESSIKEFMYQNKSDIIMLLAGSKNVKELENNKEYAYQINVKPVESFIKYITDEKFVYFSSDYVFDGKKGNYTVSDDVQPLTVYGKNKVQVEELMQKSNIKYSIIRTAGVLGKQSVFFSWLCNTLKQEKQVEMFSNSYFTPTCVKFLCEVTEKIINEKNNNIYHVVQGERISRYELSCIIQSLLQSDCNILPIEKDYIDRSLIQDNFTKNLISKSFQEYLKEELCIN